MLTILSSFGFWGAHNMANKSQTKRFEKIYTTIKNNNNTASKTELEQLRSILDFLEDRKIATQLNRTIGFNIEDFRETSKYREKSGHLNQNKILTALHIQQDPSEATIEKPRNKHYSLNNFNNFKLSTSIKEYDNFTFISYYRTEEIIDAGIYDIDLNMETVKMSIYSKTDSLRKIKIPLEKKLLELSSKNIKLNNLNTEEFIIQTQNDTMKVKLILTELNYYVEDGKKIDFMSFSAYLFIKEK